MLTLYKSLIRSRLEYCCPFWDPTKIQDIVTLEGIQRSFTSKIVSVAHLDYHDRLKELKMMSLQRRRGHNLLFCYWPSIYVGVQSEIFSSNIYSQYSMGVQ